MINNGAPLLIEDMNAKQPNHLLGSFQDPTIDFQWNSPAGARAVLKAKAYYGVTANNLYTVGSTPGIMEQAATALGVSIKHIAREIADHWNAWSA